MSRRWLATLFIVGVTALLVVLWRPAGEDGRPEPLRVASLLGDAEADGLRGAEPSYRPVFPEDHGAHPDYRSEWWYFTGSLDDPGGRRYGFQFTIFRFALAAARPERASRWATRQVWMGHLALTDVDGERHFRAERIVRGGPMALAGASAEPFRAWIGPWEMASAGPGFLPAHLSAEGPDFALDLRVSPGRGPVLQGEDGFSRKGPGNGNASYYYSYPRLPVSGEIAVDGETVPVSGEAWLDREWGTSALGPDVEGWDWFALQLDDGTELMYYQLRRADGSADPLSAGTLTGALTRKLGSSELSLVPKRFWKSPETGARYPVSWELEVPSEGLFLEVGALLDAQEMDLSVHYWEGAVEASGSRGGRAVRGRGYLEMTGYDR